MIRFVDKSALEYMRAATSLQEALFRKDPTAFLTYIDGFARDKKLGAFRSFVYRKLEGKCDRCLILFFAHALSNSQDPRGDFLSLIDGFESFRPFCIACGTLVALDSDYVVTSPESQGADGTVFHTSCVRKVVLTPESWSNCAICSKRIPRDELRTATRTLRYNRYENRGRRLRYRDVCWRLLEIDEKQEYAQLSARIPASLPIVERMKRFKALLPKPDPDLLGTGWDAYYTRRHYEPIHMHCRGLC